MDNVNEWNKTIIAEFRANAGKVGGQFAQANLLLLHTKGAKSGAERINPLVYFTDGDRMLIAASKGGAPSNPDWYYNILANPMVTLEVGTETFSAMATVAEEPERTRLFEGMAAQNPGFAEYQKNTERIIPVVILTRQA